MIQQVQTAAKFLEMVYAQPDVSLALAFGQYVELPEVPEQFPCFVTKAGNSLEVVPPEQCFYANINDRRGWLRADSLDDFLREFQLPPRPRASPIQDACDPEMAGMAHFRGSASVVYRGDYEHFWIRREEDGGFASHWKGKVFMRRNPANYHIYVALTDNPAEAVEILNRKSAFVFKTPKQLISRYMHVTTDRLHGPKVEHESHPLWVVNGSLSLTKPMPKVEVRNSNNSVLSPNAAALLTKYGPINLYDELAGLAGNVAYDMPNRRAALQFTDREFVALGRWGESSPTSSQVNNAITVLQAAINSGRIQVPSGPIAKLCVDGKHINNTYVSLVNGKLVEVPPVEVKLEGVYTLSWRERKPGCHVDEPVVCNVQAKNPSHALKLFSAMVNQGSLPSKTESSVLMSFSGGSTTVTLDPIGVFPTAKHMSALSRNAMILAGEQLLSTLATIVSDPDWPADRINIWHVLRLLEKNQGEVSPPSGLRLGILTVLEAAAKKLGYHETLPIIEAFQTVAPTYSKPVPIKTGTNGLDDL